MEKLYCKKRLERMLTMMSDLSMDTTLVVEPAAAQYFAGLNLAYLGGKVFMLTLELEATEAIDEGGAHQLNTFPRNPD